MNDEVEVAAPRSSVPAEAPPRRRRWVRPLLLLAIPALVVAIGLGLYLHGGRYISTDNAYVGAEKVNITPEVSGKVLAVSVSEGQPVKVGEPLLTIDPSTYRIALQDAQARLATVETSFATLKDQYASLTRQLDLARKTLSLRESDLGRKTELLGNRTGSRSEAETAEISVMAARGQIEQIEHSRSTTLHQLQGNPDLALADYPPYREAQAAVALATENLNRTTVRAPIAGVATQVSSIQLGRYLQAGASVFAIIAKDHPWVDANLKETDLTWLKPGQPVTITVDAYPDRTWRGHVASISPGTGAQFAILPPQNASGNWVKVVQRVPVRVEFDDQSDSEILRAGMSSTIEIDTGRQRPLASLLGFGAFASASPPAKSTVADRAR